MKNRSTNVGFAFVQNQGAVLVLCKGYEVLSRPAVKEDVKGYQLLMNVLELGGEDKLHPRSSDRG